MYTPKPWLAIAGTIVLFSVLLAPATVAGQACDTSGWPVAAWPNTDFCKASISPEEVLSGGPGRDGIPAITDPVMESVASAATWLAPASPVIVIEREGDARAYPLAILTWHEIANDTVGGDPVAVTFCPLCNSAIVFDRRVGDQVLEFGVSGLLRASDMIMYDRQTESWWQQLTGEALAGELHGAQLTFLPSQVTGFAQFAERYPDGQVMSRDTGFVRSYGRNPTPGYDSAARPFLFDGTVDPRLPAMERVLAGLVDGVPVAYPFAILSEAIVINDTVAEQPVAAFWQPGVVSALDQSVIDASRDIGTAALFSRQVGDAVLTFSMNDEGEIIDDQTGSTWSLFGEALAGELAGTRLNREIAGATFWFAWAAFHPETIVYGN